MQRFIKKLLSGILVATMLVTTATTSFANTTVIGGSSNNTSNIYPISSGGTTIIGQADNSNITQFSSASIDIALASANTTTPVAVATPSDAIKDDFAIWLDEYSKWAEKQSVISQMPMMMSDGIMLATANTPTPPLPTVSNTSVKQIIWSGGGRIEFGGTPTNPYFINSPGAYITVDGQPAFCFEYNGLTPSGPFDEGAPGSTSGIKQILANFDASSKGNAEYMAAQVSIWCILKGDDPTTDIHSWGTSGVTSSIANEIINGNEPTALIQFKTWTDTSGIGQNILTYSNDTEPDIPPIDPPTDPPTTTTDEEISEARGQLLIRKSDIHGNPLNGATFDVSIRFSNGDVQRQEGVLVNGQDLITWTHPANNIGAATVTVSEVTAPDGYILDPTPQTVSVSPSYSIIKTVTTTTVTSTGGTGGEGGTVGSGGAGGEGGSSNVTVDTEVFTTNVAGDLDIEVNFINEMITTGIRVMKLDFNTNAPLAGATIQIKGADLDPAVAGVTAQQITEEHGIALFEDLIPGSYVVTEIAAPSGYVLNSTPITVAVSHENVAEITIQNEKKPGFTIQKVDQNGVPLAGAVFEVRRGSGELVTRATTGINGQIFLDNLTTDTYVVEEIEAPDGYMLDPNPLQTIHIDTTDDTKNYLLTFVNQRKPNITIIKVDGDNPTKMLEGATFKITDEATGNEWDVTTMADGKITLENLEPYKTYLIEETIAPQGYLEPTFSTTLTLEPGKTHELTVQNFKEPVLEIHKVDADNNLMYLPGAIFEIKDETTGITQQGTTNYIGRLTFENLIAGRTYTVREVSAPNGYIATDEVQTVVLATDKVNGLIFENEQKPEFTIHKVDSITGQSLEGATFTVEKITDTGIEDIGVFITDENGEIRFNNLDHGRYRFTETKAPNGYIIDQEVHEITLDNSNNNQVLTIENTPYTSLTIAKIDAITRVPLEGAVFNLYDSEYLQVGKYSTGETGVAHIANIAAGRYYIKEVQAPNGYNLSDTVYSIDISEGKNVTVEIKNEKLGSLKIIKADAVTGEPLYGAVFNLYDMSNNLLGEFTTDQNGVIELSGNIVAGKYKLKEVKAPDGYLLNETIHTVELKSGETTEYTIENQPERGKIHITKKAGDDNPITGDKAGTVLEDAVFEIFDKDGTIVDTITTNSIGIATSTDLPLGIYGIREITAPEHYQLEGAIFYAEIKVAGDVIRFEVINYSKKLEVDVHKHGNIEAMSGDVIRYDFDNISNLSNVALDDFYWRDILPTDAVRLTEINTGTWSEYLTYSVEYQTNKRSWRTLEDDLSTQQSYTLSVENLKSGEYVTEIRFNFGTVQSGFTQVEPPYIFCRVLENLPHQYRFTNRTDVGGRSGDEWVIDKDMWTTIIYLKEIPKLPQTGY